MSDKTINIVYIDDQIDEMISAYMNSEYCAKPFQQSDTVQISKKYKEVPFCKDDNYESLLQNPVVKAANVILIDNRLFEERSSDAGQFSGKQFKIILRKVFPYIEVIVITQNEILTGENIVRKFFDRHEENAVQYYQKNLEPCLNHAIEEVLEFENLADDLKQSSEVEKVLVDKVLSSLNGDDSYDELSKQDIDELIRAFREIKDVCK